MPCKVVVFYNQAERGWSETFYIPDSVPPVTLNSTAWVSFLTAAIGLRAAPCVIKAVRITPIGVATVSQLYVTSSQYYSGGTNGLGSGLLPDPSSTDAVFQLYNFALTTKRRIFVRGLPDAWVIRDAQGNDLQAGTFITAYNKFFSGMTGLGGEIRRTLPPGAPPNQLISVQQVNAHVTNPNWSTLTLAAASTYNLATNPIILSRGVPFDDLPGFPRRATVVALSDANPFTVTIAYRFRNTQAVHPKNMRIQQTAYAYEFIKPATSTTGGWIFERFSEHKTGRPFGSLRGRSRALVRAQ
jgi:hypothetical protein